MMPPQRNKHDAASPAASAFPRHFPLSRPVIAHGRSVPIDDGPHPAGIPLHSHDAGLRASAAGCSKDRHDEACLCRTVVARRARCWRAGRPEPGS